MQQAKTNSPSLSVPSVEPFSDDRVGQVNEQPFNTPVLHPEDNASLGFASDAAYIHNNSNMNDVTWPAVN